MTRSQYLKGLQRRTKTILFSLNFSNEIATRHLIIEFEENLKYLKKYFEREFNKEV